MRQLNIWVKIKKPLFIGLYILASLILCFAVLHITNGASKKLFDNVLDVFPFFVTAASALTWALFNYIEGVLKDVSELKGDQKKIDKAINALTDLKNEVISNAAFIIFLLILDAVLNGISSFYGEDSTLIQWLILSVRGCIIFLAIYAAFDQFQGFKTAQQFRLVINQIKNKAKS
ncbi:hypothetical protein L1D46_15610 [Pseudoalteromonas sp. Isolate3]|uniref:hypothetical protein n=1 Tax=Pseudoalteromonas sp. Isolate3 TaxID=2908526 RepID=UPI001EFC56B8|nr:hypothetical protein [Pseudoalteromonas sp. Isolate3]MCG9710222.1 hypothetical protein [Pseudoalteromonas sp. Isolate3]